MQLGLEGSVAAIAGGANGIGAAIAREFAAEGAAVAILDVADETEATAESIRESSGRPTVAMRADITDSASLAAARAGIEAALGPTDHVVVAAGIGSGKFGFPFLNVPPGDWRRVLEVNVEGSVRVAHEFTPGLIERGRGTLLFISSVAAQFGSQTDPPYSASKAAVLNFAQCAARDLAPHGVRVNSICPGMVRTRLNRSVWESWNQQQAPEDRRSYEDWADEKVRRVVPLGRWQEPEDIAHLTVFLASERARNITGQTMNVDGGYVMR